MSNVDFAPIEMNGCNQPIFVAADIEHNPLSNFVSGGEGSAEVGEAFKLRLSHDFEPAGQCEFTIRMLCPKLAQSFPRDYVHIASVSQNEIFGKALAEVDERSNGWLQ